MLKVSNKYAEAILADSRDMPYFIEINGVRLDQTQVPSMVLSESMSGSNGLSLGTANAAELTLTLRDPAITNYDGMLVEPYSGLVLPDGSTEWVPLGKFWVTKTTTSNDYKTVKLTCIDGMYHMSKEFVPTFPYPCHIEFVVLDIAKQAGVSLTPPDVWPDVYVRRKPEGMTLRNAIGYAAGCIGRNARFNRYGYLELAWYKDHGITIERRSQYMDGMTKLHDQPLEVGFEVTGEVEEYELTIKLQPEEAGRITASKYAPLEGDDVLLTVKLNEGYQLSDIRARGNGLAGFELTAGADGKYSFTQPDYPITVEATAVSLNPGELWYCTVMSRPEGAGNLAVKLGPYGSDVNGPLFATGEQVYIKVIPAEGYRLKELGKQAGPTGGGDLSFAYTDSSGFDWYTLTMPEGGVIVDATFEAYAPAKLYCIGRCVASPSDKGTVSVLEGANGVGDNGPLFAEGEQVYVKVSPAEGCQLTRLDANFSVTPDVQLLSTDEDGTQTYTFVMPASDGSIIAIFGASATTMSLRSRAITAEPVTLTYTNPMIYEKMVPAIQAIVQSITYTPARVKHRGNPAFQAGDIVTVPDSKGVEHKVLIMQQTMTFGGGMNAEIFCPGQTADNANFSSSGPLNAQIQKEVGKSNKELEARLKAEYERKLRDAEFLIEAGIKDLETDVGILTDLVSDVEHQADALEDIVLAHDNQVTELFGRVKTLEEGTDSELAERVTNVETGLKNEIAARKAAIESIRQVPSGGAAGQVLTQTENGTAEWRNVEQKKTTTGLNFSQWDNGQFTEVVEGDETEHVYTVEFDEEGRPITITDEDGQALSITW